MGLRNKDLVLTDQYVVKEAPGGSHLERLLNKMHEDGYEPISINAHHIQGSTVGYLVTFRRRSA